MIAPRPDYKDIRPTMIETLFDIAQAWERRSTCLRGTAGAVIATHSGGVLSQGYNGAPRGISHCTDVGCILDGNHCVRSVHAEMNAIIWAAQAGIALRGGMLVSTMRPCIRCAIAIIQAGISRVYYDYAYDSDDMTTALLLFEEAGVDVYRRHA